MLSDKAEAEAGESERHLLVLVRVPAREDRHQQHEEVELVDGRDAANRLLAEEEAGRVGG